MENSFFKKALGKATNVTSRQQRMLSLVAQLFKKLQHLELKDANLPELKARLAVFGRIGRAYALGHYRDIPWKTLVTMTAAVIYFVNPLDLVPDVIPVTGLVDDFGVLIWVYGSISQEVQKFLAWERTQLP